MLVLFDIDNTLLDSHGAGRRAMMAACREMFGRDDMFDTVEIAGRLDSLIFHDLAAGADADGQALHDTFRQHYIRAFTAETANGSKFSIMPGIVELVDALGRHDDLTLGLLTGNYPETGWMKIEKAGLPRDPFIITAWGCDGEHRRDLPPVAMSRYHDRFDRAVNPTDVIILGDTPHDVDCARHNRCRSIGVATGRYDLPALEACGPDLAVADLSRTDEIVEFITRTM